MTIGRSWPDSSRYFAFRPSEYLVPSLKMLPISMTRSISSALPHCTHASPGATVCRSTKRGWKSRPLGPAARELAVGGIVAAPADRDLALARRARSHELVRPEAAHHPGVRLHDPEAQATALEDLAVGRRVGGVRAVEGGRVGIERVGIFHDELAGAEHARARPRLVALLRLDLVPDLRQVSI